MERKEKTDWGCLTILALIFIPGSWIVFLIYLIYDIINKDKK